MMIPVFQNKLANVPINHLETNKSSFPLLKEMLYEKPFNMSIAGTAKTVSGLTRKNIIDLFHSIYSSNNMIFSVWFYDLRLLSSILAYPTQKLFHVTIQLDYENL